MKPHNLIIPTLLLLHLVFIGCVTKSASSTFVTPTSTVTVPTKSAVINNVLLDFALSPDGSKLAVYTNSGIYIYDIEMLTKVTFSEFSNLDYQPRLWAGAIAFNPDGTMIAISDKQADHAVDIWDLETGKYLTGTYDIPNGHYVTEIEFSPDGNSIFIRSTYPSSMRCEMPEDSLALHIYPLEPSSSTKIFEKYFCDYVPGEFRFTKGGKFYLFRRSMAYDYWVSIVDTKTGQIIEDNQYEYKDGEFYDISPDGVVLAVAETQNDQQVTKLVDAKMKTTLMVIPYKVRFLNDETRFMVRDESNVWKLWQDGRIFCSFDEVKGYPKWKFSADENYFAIAKSYKSNQVDKSIQIWSTSNCKKTNTIHFGN